MPFKSKKQKKWLQINRPDIWKKWKSEEEQKKKYNRDGKRNAAKKKRMLKRKR